MQTDKDIYESLTLKHYEFALKGVGNHQKLSKIPSRNWNTIFCKHE
jgi:hypothetical protein